MDSLKWSVIVALSLVLAAAAAAAEPEALILTSDYTTGGLSALSGDPEWNVESDLAPICPDAVARVSNGFVYVVNRMGCDNIEVIDPVRNWDIRGEFSVGGGTNPQDIAFVSRDRAYVTRYETNWLLEVDPSTGAVLDSVSLAALADEDGICEMHCSCLIGRELFIEVQRIDRVHFTPVPPSVLAVVDVDTNELLDLDPVVPGVQGIVLEGLNPAAPMRIDPATGDLLVPEAGAFGVLDAGGLERVDPHAHRSKGFVITEGELGGDLSYYAPVSDTLAYAVVADEGGNTALVSFNPASGRRTGVLYRPGGYVLADCMVSSRGHLLLADRDYTNPGVRIYDAASGVFLAGPLSTGLSPIAFLSAEGVAPSESGAKAPLWLPVPNPARGPVELRSMASTDAAFVRTEIFNMAGRRIGVLSVSPAMTDPVWNLSDDTGRIVSSGIYRMRRTAADGRVETHAVTVLR
jgi:hypothetical protein